MSTPNSLTIPSIFLAGDVLVITASNRTLLAVCLLVPVGYTSLLCSEVRLSLELTLFNKVRADPTPSELLSEPECDLSHSHRDCSCSGDTFWGKTFISLSLGDYQEQRLSANWTAGMNRKQRCVVSYRGLNWPNLTSMWVEGSENRPLEARTKGSAMQEATGILSKRVSLTLSSPIWWGKAMDSHCYRDGHTLKRYVKCHGLLSR